MAEIHNEVMTLVNGEAAAIEPYRRVKYHSTMGQVVYADASDGDSWIGTTLPGSDGDAVATGGFVSIELRGEHKTIKVECGAAVTKNAPLYPEDDGKVSDDAGTVVIGTAAGTSLGTGDGSILEMHPNAGSGSAPDEEAVADADATTSAGIGIVLQLLGSTALSTVLPILQPARKLQPVRAWGVLREQTTASDALLKIGATDICAAVTFDTAEEVQDFLLNDAVTEIPAAGTLYLSNATAVTAPGLDVYLLCVPVA